MGLPGGLSGPDLIVVGNTLAARKVGGTVIDPVHAEPYPLRKVKVGDQLLPFVPIVTERCPGKCVPLGSEAVLKEGGHEKACKGMKCYDPWPKRWKDMSKRYLVLDLEVKGNIKVVPARILKLERGKLVLSGWRVVEFDEIVWTAPFPYLASFLNLQAPRRLEATVALFKADVDWDLAYHLGKANPFYALVRFGEWVWALGPGTFDALGAVTHLHRKGYLRYKGGLVSYTVDYYALERAEVRAPEWVRLFGRTAEWREVPLEEFL